MSSASIDETRSWKTWWTSCTWQAYSSVDQRSGRVRSAAPGSASRACQTWALRGRRAGGRVARPRGRRGRTPRNGARAPRSSPWCRVRASPGGLVIRPSSQTAGAPRRSGLRPAPHGGQERVRLGQAHAQHPHGHRYAAHGRSAGRVEHDPRPAPARWCSPATCHPTRGHRSRRSGRGRGAPRRRLARGIEPEGPAEAHPQLRVVEVDVPAVLGDRQHAHQGADRRCSPRQGEPHAASVRRSPAGAVRGRPAAAASSAVRCPDEEPDQDACSRRRRGGAPHGRAC